MSAAEYQKLIAQCRTPRDLENLLTRWHEVQGNLDQLAEARNAWLDRSIELADSCERGEAGVETQMKGLQVA
jgi:hypothetical protein